MDGARARALTREAEAIAVVAHAIYKEHIYLLSDYYVIKEWLNSDALKLARELKVEEAVHAGLKINKQIEGGRAETPLKVNPAQTTITLTRKFMEDPNFRTTTLNIMKLATKKRTIKQLTQRLKRRSY